MKMDKETVIKHHFWGLLGLAIPLSVVGILVIMTAVGADIRNNKNKLEEAYKKVSSSDRDFKNQDWVDQMKRAARAKKAEEEEVWKKAYDKQKDIFTWAAAFQEQFDFQQGLFAVGIRVFPKSPGGAGGKDEPAKGIVFTHRGTIIESHQGWFEVGNEKIIDKKPVSLPRLKFLPTPEILNKSSKKIVQAQGGKEINFIDLKPGEWAEVSYEKGRYFGDPLTDDEQKAFAKTYSSQIDGILSQVNPVTARGDGVVQLRGWFYKKGDLPQGDVGFLRFVATDWDTDQDISQEAWIAQEDLWIQREIYRLVRLANDYVSLFRGEGGDDSSKSYRFTNPYWQLDLKLAGPKKLQVKITNLQARRQKLDLPFLVRTQPKGDPVRIVIGGREPLNPQESYELTVDLDKGPQPTGIYGVEQVIDWESAAVKRIDLITIGAPSSVDCRHAQLGGIASLRTFKIAPKTASRAIPAKGDAKGDAAKGGVQVTRNGLIPVRYSEITKQARLLPVAVSLIVAQEHVDRVLLAFTNSPFRFLTTQVLMSHYSRSLRPALNQVAGRSGGQDNQDAEVRISPAKIGKIRPPNPGNPFNQVDTGAQGGVSSSDDQESNVELVLYGVVTLYERYPPRPGASK